MAIPQEQQDYAFYWQLFKGNYLKGAEALSGILSVPQTAEKLTTNINALNAIYNVGANVTATNTSCIVAIDKSPYGNTALNNYFRFVGIDVKPTFEETISDLPTVTAIADNKAAVSALCCSPNAFNIAVTLENTIKILSYSKTALDAVLATPTAFTKSFEIPYRYIRTAFMQPEYTAKVYGYMGAGIAPYNVSPKNTSLNFSNTGKTIPFAYGNTTCFIGGGYIYFHGSYDSMNRRSAFRASLSDPLTTASITGVPLNLAYQQTAIINNTVYYYGSVHAEGSNGIMSTPLTPVNVINTGRTLLAPFYYGSLAVIGDYIYLYGGAYTDRIMRASINAPTTFFNTGKTLPYSYSGGSLAIIGDYVYLFGGSSPRSVMRATLKNPTEFINTGTTLPYDYTGGSLAIVGDNVYLCGSMTTGVSSTIIMGAPLNNLSTFTIRGYLAYGYSYGTLVIVDDFIYLYGGSSNMTNIMSCPLID